MTATQDLKSDTGVARPMTADELLRQAVALHQGGELAQAAAIYQQILATHPRHAGALHLLGVARAAAGNPREGIRLIGRSIELNPADPVAHDNLGLAYQDAGDWLAALASFGRALALQPDLAVAHFHRGRALRQLGRWDEAVRAYDQAIAGRSDFAAAWCDRGIALCGLHHWEAALGSFDRAIALQPDLIEAHGNRAFPLRELGRFDEAVQTCRDALARRPDYHDAHVNLASVLYTQRRVTESLAEFDAAVALAPDNAHTRVNRGLARLLSGDYAGGWSDYHWRWRDPGGWVYRERLDVDQPLWLGDFPLDGRTILLQAEQGHGDTLQFCRYAPLVAALGARVILGVPAALAPLLGSLKGVSAVVAQGGPLPPFDCYCPLLSLPLAMRTTLDSVPGEVPYLHPGEERRSWWRQRLGPGSRLRVGIAWASGFRPSQPELWATNSRRNLPLAQLAALRDVEAEFHSLQKGQDAEAELAALVAQGWEGPPILDMSAELRDFADTAALIEQLDLVISVDTAVAHLAGALGKPVWILNRFDGCWRWLLDREDSPWYPTARLYRQPVPGVWDTVVARLAADLRELVRQA